MHRDQYLGVLGWRLETHDGVYSLARDPSAAAAMPPASPSMDGLALLEGCLADGLALQDEAAARQRLENHDVMLIGPEPQAEAQDHVMADAMVGVPEPVTSPPPNTPPEPLELFGALARMNPTAAMAVLLQIPMDSPRLSQGVEYYELENADDLINVFQPENPADHIHDTLMIDMGITLPGTVSMLQPLDAFAVSTLPADTMEPLDALEAVENVQQMGALPPVTAQDVFGGTSSPPSHACGTSLTLRRAESGARQHDHFLRSRIRVGCQTVETYPRRDIRGEGIRARDYEARRRCIRGETYPDETPRRDSEERDSEANTGRDYGGGDQRPRRKMREHEGTYHGGDTETDPTRAVQRETLSVRRPVRYRMRASGSTAAPTRDAPRRDGHTVVYRPRADH